MTINSHTPIIFLDSFIESLCGSSISQYEMSKNLNHELHEFSRIVLENPCGSVTACPKGKSVAKVRLSQDFHDRAKLEPALV